MSIRMTPVLVCDGCGTVIDMDTYIKRTPTDQSILQQHPEQSTERDFCCDACEAWWQSEYPETGAWGPAWEERDWWHHQLQDHAFTRVRTAHEEMPLFENHSYFDDPEPLK